MSERMSSCEEARAVLWPLDRPREVREGERAARAHLDECSACRAFFERDASISRALRAHDLETRPPDALRERVLAAVRRETPRRPSFGSRRRGGWRTIPWVAAAAVAGLTFGLSRSGTTSPNMYAQDFLSRAVEADAVVGPDAQAVSSFFMRELGVPIAPVSLASAPMSRAMICLIDGERAALVEYEVDGYTLAHYRVPRVDGRVARAAAPTMSEENGVCVYRWTDERFQHALVSDMPEARLLAVARSAFDATAP